MHTYLQFPIFLKSHHLRAQHYIVLQFIYFILLSQSHEFHCVTQIANEIFVQQTNKQTAATTTTVTQRKKEK